MKLFYRYYAVDDLVHRSRLNPSALRRWGQKEKGVFEEEQKKIDSFIKGDPDPGDEIEIKGQRIVCIKNEK